MTTSNLSLTEATLDEILAEIKQRYAYAGGIVGLSVVVTEHAIVTSANVTVEALAELGKKLTICAYMMLKDDDKQE
jgi:hypothetical protein